MEKRKYLREDPLGTVLMSEEDKPIGLYTRCPHCGMTDLDNVNQSIQRTHWRNSSVGCISTYQCGKCRVIFKTIEITVPDGMEPMELYERVNSEWEGDVLW